MSQYLWWRDGCIYQIYPRSFVDSNGDGIGDLNGITARLDYLAGLGVDAIWLSPINPSPDVDFGYDVSDYTAIDPKYGTMQDFDRLVAEAHARGIRVVLDLVLNHTSDQHAWFVQSRSGRDNPYRDWYLWADPAPGGGVPNNWESVFGGKGWEWDAASGQYYFHMFYKEQPDLNWRNPAVRQAMLDVFRFWLERGVDGFRLDVFNVYFKDAALRSNPPKFGIRGFDRQRHMYDVDQPEMEPLLAEIRALLDHYAERYAVGETFESTPQLAARYCRPGLLHGTFNFKFLQNRWNPAGFLRSIQEWEGALDSDSWPTWVLNNHDVRRAGTRYSPRGNDERLKLLAGLLLTLRGTPFLYQGEEIGMRDIPIKRSEIRDPIGRRYWPIYPGRDGCRSPMQWDSSANAGFTSGAPWLPVHANAAERNVEEQQGDPDSLLNFYRRLLSLRRANPALRRGMFQPVTFTPKKILAYLREDANQTVLVAMNFGGRTHRLVLGSELARRRWRLLLSNKREHLDAEQFALLALRPNEVCILEQC